MALLSLTHDGGKGTDHGKPMILLFFYGSTQMVEFGSTLINMHASLIQVTHPIIDHSLSILRDKNCTTDRFRHNANIVSKLLIIEATKHLATTPYMFETPLSQMQGKKLTENIVVVPVLRAGLAMLFACQDILPQAAVGFVGMQRDEQTAIAFSYYKKLPEIFNDSEIFVLDPMLATGGSFDDTVREVKNKGGKNIRVVCIVAAPEGIKRIQQSHPDVAIYTAAIDDHLNDKKYIVPGLGDFGDRYFGTV